MRKSYFGIKHLPRGTKKWSKLENMFSTSGPIADILLLFHEHMSEI